MRTSDDAAAVHELQDLLGLKQLRRQGVERGDRDGRLEGLALAEEVGERREPPAREDAVSAEHLRLPEVDARVRLLEPPVVVALLAEDLAELTHGVHGASIPRTARRKSAPGRIRTCDQRLRRPPLFH